MMLLIGLFSVIVEVMSFNVRMSGQPEIDGEFKWDNRKVAVASMLAEKRPDVAGMQEVLPDQLVFLDSVMTSLGYGRIGVGRDDGHLEGECMALYYDSSRFVLRDSGTFWLSETPGVPSFGWDAACKRTATWAVLHDKDSGQEFCCINTHLDHVGQVARTESVRLLAAMADSIAGEGMPVILNGDFNAEPDDEMFDAMPESFRLAGDVAENRTCVSSFNGFGKIEAPVDIDHIFVRGAEVLEFVTVTDDYGVEYISDHYPVIVKVCRYQAYREG